MRSREFEGKTIDEAIEKACSEFKVSREKLSIEIISEGASGFLGLVGNKKAKIAAALLSLEEALEAPFKKPYLPAEHSRPDAIVVDKPPLPHHEINFENGLALRAKMILEGILTRMDLHCPITVSETPDDIILNIEGDGSGLLIGKRGQNLDAIQYIINKAAHKFGNGHKKIIVDTESYRKRREESLIALAAKLGEKVKKTKKAVSLSSLNAHNRRIIHLALQNDASIITKSRGEGEYRKIIILPIKKE